MGAFGDKRYNFLRNMLKTALCGHESAAQAAGSLAGGKKTAGCCDHSMGGKHHAAARGCVMKEAQQTPGGDGLIISFQVYVLVGGNGGLGMTIVPEAWDVSVLGLWNCGEGRAAMAAKHLCCPLVLGLVPTDLAAADVVLLPVSDRAIPLVGSKLTDTCFSLPPYSVHSTVFDFISGGCHVQRGL